MSKLMLLAIKWHPFAVLAVYAFLVAGYSRYLDAGMKYIRPQLPAAPEDILGLGFWVPWLLIVTWFVFACLFSYRFDLLRTGYWAVLVCIFGLLTAVDFYLYGVLEQQVLAG